MQGLSQTIVAALILAVAVAVVFGVLGWIRGLMSAGTAEVKVYPDTYIVGNNQTLCLHVANQGGKPATIYRVEAGAAYADLNIVLGPGEEYQGCIQLTGALPSSASTTIRLYTKDGNVIPAIAVMLAPSSQGSGPDSGGVPESLEGATILIDVPPYEGPPFPEDIQLTLNGYIEITAAESGSIAGVSFNAGDRIRLEFSGVTVPTPETVDMQIGFYLPRFFTIQEVTVSRIIVNGVERASNIFVENYVSIMYLSYNIDLVINIAIVNGDTHIRVVDENGEVVYDNTFNSWSGTLRLHVTNIYQGMGFIDYQSAQSGSGPQLDIARFAGSLQIIG